MKWLIAWMIIGPVIVLGFTFEFILRLFFNLFIVVPTWCFEWAMVETGQQSERILTYDKFSDNFFWIKWETE